GKITAGGAVAGPVAGPQHALAVPRWDGVRFARVAAGEHAVLVGEALHRPAAVELDCDDLVVEPPSRPGVVVHVRPTGPIQIAGGDVMWEALASGIGERGDGAVAQPHHHDSADLLAVHDPPAQAAMLLANEH